jgi:hypothetical protein
MRSGVVHCNPTRPILSIFHRIRWIPLNPASCPKTLASRKAQPRRKPKDQQNQNPPFCQQCSLISRPKVSRTTSWDRSMVVRRFCHARNQIVGAFATEIPRRFSGRGTGGAERGECRTSFLPVERATSHLTAVEMCATDGLDLMRCSTIMVQPFRPLRMALASFL